MIYNDRVVMCCLDDCQKPATHGYLLNGDRYEWWHVCKEHTDGCDPEIDTLRPIEHTPPFCDELTAMIPEKKGD